MLKEKETKKSLDEIIAETTANVNEYLTKEKEEESKMQAAADFDFYRFCVERYGYEPTTVNKAQFVSPEQIEELEKLNRMVDESRKNVIDIPRPNVAANPNPVIIDSTAKINPVINQDAPVDIGQIFNSFVQA